MNQHPREELGTGATVHQEDGTVRRGDDVIDEAQRKTDQVQVNWIPLHGVHSYGLT